MRIPKTQLWPLLILIAVSLACGSSAPEATPTTDAGAVATIVAATMAANEAQPTTAVLEPAPNSTPTETAPPKPQTSPTSEPPYTGLTVAYLDGGNVWLWREDGTRRQLTSTGNAQMPHLSDDGTRVAYLQWLDPYAAELRAVDAEGGNDRLLISAADLAALPRPAEAIATQIFQLAWVPNSHTLAYNTRPIYDGPGLSGNNDLHLVDADLGTHTQLLSAGQGGQFSYARDGSQIAISTPESLSLINADGSNRRDLLTFPFIYTYSEWAFYPIPVWAPDASYVRVAIPPQDPLANPAALTFIWHLPADGSMPYMAGEVVTAPAFIGQLLLSPDTRKAIYLYPPGEAFDNLELHILDLDTARDTLYHAGQLSLVGWNPDATRFVFAQGSDLLPFLGLSGALPVSLPGVPAAQGIRWVDAERFFYLQGSFNAWELRLGSLTGTSSSVATPSTEFIDYDFIPKP